MNEVREVAGTAFIVAEFRALENEETHPLYLDPVVHIFLDERTKKAAAAIRADFPAGQKMPRLRTRYYDDRLDAQLANGCRQVVILGSGLDTRAERKRADGVAYFEIDDASTIEFKKARLGKWIRCAGHLHSRQLRRLRRAPAALRQWFQS
jgi:methyltransferase (TIGR00027 family)